MTALRLLEKPLVLDDAEIRELALKNRAAAADAAVRKYRDPLFHHAAYILKDWTEATDVVQEVFIKALREPRFFGPEFNMKAWLFRVTSNLCFNIRRDRRRRSAILDANPQASSAAASQGEVVLRTQQQRQIMAGIEQLGEHHREILVLRYYSDLSYAEIADVLDVKLGTVMSRLSRARVQLLDVLQAAGVEADDHLPG